MTTLSLPETDNQAWFPVPILGLVDDGDLEFPVYLPGSSKRPPVLYAKPGGAFDREREESLASGGIRFVLVRKVDRRACLRRLEKNLEFLARDPSCPVEVRGKLLHEAALSAAEDVFAGRPDREAVARGERVVRCIAGLVLEDRSSFLAIRRVLTASTRLAAHSVNVMILCLGLAGRLSISSAELLARYGLAGLLHDLGRVGAPGEGLDGRKEDPGHVTRGAALLAELGLPEEVREAARQHHERHDGSGYPGGLAGEEISPVSRVVALVDVFEGIRAEHSGRIGLFDCFRILGTSHKGCFHPEVVKAFLRTFGA